MPKKKKDELRRYQIVNIKEKDSLCPLCSDIRVVNLCKIPEKYCPDLGDLEYIDVRLEYDISSGELSMTPVVYFCEYKEDEEGLNIEDDKKTFVDVNLGDAILIMPVKKK